MIEFPLINAEFLEGIITMDEIKQILKAIQHAQEETHAKMVAIEDTMLNQFREVKQDTNKRFDKVDAEFRHIKRRLDRIDTDLDTALDRIEMIEGQQPN